MSNPHYLMILYPDLFRKSRYAKDEDGTHWITIGGKAADGKKHKGGFPVLIGSDGKIVASAAGGLHGKHVSEVKSHFDEKRKGGKAEEKHAEPEKPADAKPQQFLRMLNESTTFKDAESWLDKMYDVTNDEWNRDELEPLVYEHFGLGAVPRKGSRMYLADKLKGEFQKRQKAAAKKADSDKKKADTAEKSTAVKEGMKKYKDNPHGLSVYLLQNAPNAKDVQIKTYHDPDGLKPSSQYLEMRSDYNDVVRQNIPTVKTLAEAKKAIADMKKEFDAKVKQSSGLRAARRYVDRE